MLTLIPAAVSASIMMQFQEKINISFPQKTHCNYYEPFFYLLNKKYKHSLTINKENQCVSGDVK